MKEKIHPKYTKVKVVCTSCGTEFETGSTLNRDIRVDTCSNCHPFIQASNVLAILLVGPRPL